MPLKEHRKVLNYDGHGNKITEITLHERLPYCNRSVPIVFKCAFDANGYGVWSDFGEFRIEYEGNFVHLLMDRTWKAVASDAKGRQVAEAVGIGMERGVGITLRETHFDEHGAVCFSARSFLDLDGVKRQENEAIGHKQSDYFFFSPLRE